jgi:predicted nucleic acid-binding protein
MDRTPPSWLKVANLQSAVIPELSSLHSGEREVITLALEQPDLLILMDDRRGTVEARRRGLNVIGTLAALDEAANRGWIDLPEMFSHLQSTSFRSPLHLMALMLEHETQRKK